MPTTRKPPFKLGNVELNSRRGFPEGDRVPAPVMIFLFGLFGQIISVSFRNQKNCCWYLMAQPYSADSLSHLISVDSTLVKKEENVMRPELRRNSCLLFANSTSYASPKFRELFGSLSPLWCFNNLAIFVHVNSDAVCTKIHRHKASFWQNVHQVDPLFLLDDLLGFLAAFSNQFRPLVLHLTSSAVANNVPLQLWFRMQCVRRTLKMSTSTGAPEIPVKWLLWQKSRFQVHKNCPQGCHPLCLLIPWFHPQELGTKTNEQRDSLSFPWQLVHLQSRVPFRACKQSLAPFLVCLRTPITK